VTKGTLQEMHREILPHPAYSPNLAPSDFHLFGPFKEAVGGKRLEPTMKLKFSCNHKLYCKGHNEDVLAVATVYRGTGTEYVEKQVLLL
jgi:hypothetical protein